MESGQALEFIKYNEKYWEKKSMFSGSKDGGDEMNEVVSEDGAFSLEISGLLQHHTLTYSTPLSSPLSSLTRSHLTFLPLPSIS